MKSGAMETSNEDMRRIAKSARPLMPAVKEKVRENEETPKSNR
jgi:hypothetical protein